VELGLAEKPLILTAWAIQIFVFCMHTYILPHNRADERLRNCVARIPACVCVCVCVAVFVLRSVCIVSAVPESLLNRIASRKKERKTNEIQASVLRKYCRIFLDALSKLNKTASVLGGKCKGNLSVSTGNARSSRLGSGKERKKKIFFFFACDTKTRKGKRTRDV